MWLREPRPLSIHLRLLLFLGLGIGALIIGLFVLLDRSVDRQIYGYLDDTLRARAHAIAVLLESHPAPAALAQLQTMSPEYAGAWAYRLPAVVGRRRTHLARVRQQRRGQPHPTPPRADQQAIPL